MNFTDGINLSEALTITVFSMALVFVTLLAISFILDGFKAVFYKKNSPQKVEKVQQEPVKAVVATKAESSQENNDEELVAVITAAIAASISRPTSEIVVRNIVRVSQSTPVWARVGRQEQF